MTLTAKRERDRAHDAKRRAEQPYRKYYNTRAWKWARTIQLQKQPLCERCLAKGKTVAATTINHRTPHKGDWALFVDPTNHESACAPCHNQDIQQEERRGYGTAIGTDGWPLDVRHPANKKP